VFKTVIFNGSAAVWHEMVYHLVLLTPSVRIKSQCCTLSFLMLYNRPLTVHTLCNNTRQNRPWWWYRVVISYVSPMDYLFLRLHFGINLAGNLGDADPEGLVRGEVWGCGVWCARCAGSKLTPLVKRDLWRGYAATPLARKKMIFFA